MKTVFLTGTDTDVGKTVVASAILKLLSQTKKTLGFKPISAGCTPTEEGLRNDDALALLEASSVEVPYDIINPIAYEPPIAPHIAAHEVGQSIQLESLQKHLTAIQQYSPDVLLVEGAGGWRLPIDFEGPFLSDFVIQNHMPVILVVGMRLGCLNHAMLTYEAIKADGLEVMGWVANQCVEEMPYYQDNLASLKSFIKAPFLGEVKHIQSAEVEPQISQYELLHAAFD